MYSITHTYEVHTSHIADTEVRLYAERLLPSHLRLEVYYARIECVPFNHISGGGLPSPL